MEAGNPEEKKRRAEQKHKKEASEKAQSPQDQTDPGEREEKKNKSDRRESSKNVTKASDTLPKRWKRKTKSKLGNGRTACPHHKPIQREPKR